MNQKKTEYDISAMFNEVADIAKKLKKGNKHIIRNSRLPAGSKLHQELKAESNWLYKD